MVSFSFSVSHIVSLRIFPPFALRWRLFLYKVVFREPAFKNPCVLSMKQARRLVVESGPAKISGECRRHEKGESTGGGFPPLVSG